MSEPCTKHVSSSASPDFEPGEAHRLFLLAIGGDPKKLNLSTLALQTGLNVSRMWSWANGKSRWPADAWLATMQALGHKIPDPKPGLKSST